MPAKIATCLCHLSRNGTVALNVKAIVLKAFPVEDRRSELVNSDKKFSQKKEKRSNHAFVQVTEGFVQDTHGESRHYTLMGVNLEESLVSLGAHRESCVV